MCVDKRTKENEEQPINVGLLKTPVRKKEQNNKEVEGTGINPSCITIDSNQHGILNMTTPMALKDISNRAQRELAMLYSPCGEEDCSSGIECTEDKNTVAKQLF